MNLSSSSQLECHGIGMLFNYSVITTMAAAIAKYL